MRCCLKPTYRMQCMLCNTVDVRMQLWRYNVAALVRTGWDPSLHLREHCQPRAALLVCPDARSWSESKHLLHGLHFRCSEVHFGRSFRGTIVRKIWQWQVEILACRVWLCTRACLAKAAIVGRLSCREGLGRAERSTCRERAREHEKMHLQTADEDAPQDEWMTDMKWHDMKWNEMNEMKWNERNEMKWNEWMKWNEMKWNEWMNWMNWNEMK